MTALPGTKKEKTNARENQQAILLRMQLKAESPDVQAYENRVRIFLIRS